MPSATANTNPTDAAIANLDAEIERQAEAQLRGFTLGLTEELCTRLHETARDDPKSPWLRRMLLEARKP